MVHWSLWQRNVPWMRWGIALLLTGVLMLLSPAHIVRAATIIVTTPTDPVPNPSGCNGSGACSLRDAVLYANLNSGTTIQLSAPATYTLTIPPDGNTNGYSGDLKPTANMTIMGGGPSLTTIQGSVGFGDRLFKIDNNATITGGGFLPGATITFGGMPATVLAVSGTAIVVTTSGHAPGSVTIVVTNPGQPPSVYADEVIEHVVYSHPCKHPFSSVR